MAEGHRCRQEQQVIFFREAIATLYNTSANRDFKKSAVKGSDIVRLAGEEPEKPRWKASRKSKGAVKLPKKLMDALQKRFNSN